MLNLKSIFGAEDFYILSMHFRYFIIISPLEKGLAHYLNKSSLPNNALYKTHENVKSFPVSRTDEQRRGRTDERRRTDNQKSSLEPSAQVSYKQNQLPLKIKGTTLMGNV